MRMIRLLLIGLALAVVAGFLTAFLQSRLGGAGSMKPRSGPRDVVVAVRDLPAGTVLGEADLSVTPCPPDTDSRGASSMPAALIGRTAVVAVRKGQMVRDADLAARGSGAAIASQLPAGSRAITVTLRDVGPGVVLYPGATVDVFATVEAPARSGRNEAMTRMVVGRSRVLAVNDNAVGAALVGDKDGRLTTRRLSVTLAVTPAEAAQVELASTRGTVGIALCSAVDDGAPAPEVVTTSSLLGLPPETMERAVTRAPAKNETPDAQPKPSASKPEATKPEATKPEATKPAAIAAEPPKPVIWEVVVVRGQETERLNFESKPDGKNKSSGTSGGPAKP